MRNLGFSSDIQNKLALYFKSKVIDYLFDKNKYRINKNIISLKKNIRNTDFVNEIKLLTKIFKVPIYVTNLNNDIIIFSNDGEIFTNKVNLKDKLKTINLQESIKLKFSMDDLINVPNSVSVVYTLQ